MSQVIWLPEAITDLTRLIEFPKKRNLLAAKKLAQLINAGAKLLGNQPLIGKLMNDASNRRELFLPFGHSAYVLRYKLYNENVVIIRVWHGREFRNES